MAANLLFFDMHVNSPSLPHFRLKIPLYFAQADEAKTANLRGYKRREKWMPFWTKVYWMYPCSFISLCLAVLGIPLCRTPLPPPPPSNVDVDAFA